MGNKIEEIQTGLQNGFVDSTVNTNLAYSPQFVINDHRNGIKVLSLIENELLHCDGFSISVAFISRSGFVVLSETLKELEKRKIPGRILTTDYLCFSDPYALERLAKLKNIELKMYHVEDGGVGFHTKGYLFKEDGVCRVIIGSSNMTQTALTTNMEWNARFVSTEQGAMAKSVASEFERLWEDDSSRTYTDFIDSYREKYVRKQRIDRLVKEQQRIALEKEIIDYEAYTLKPNKMQENFIGNIQTLREQGKSRALLISATGTGKTYASAFAMRELKFKKVLFLVHREQILKQAKASYEKVLPGKITTGILSGNHKDVDADYLFSTVQTISRDDGLQSFDRERFECIVIDETHKAGAESYLKIIRYFRPKFLLGMTASPERTDGFDIYKLFDHNIASEIRLQDALQDDLLCPFHYFGISELEIEGNVIDDNADFRYLANEARVNHVIEQAEYFGHDGDRVKGLIFCSRNDEAKALSEAFCQRGYKAVALSGANSQIEREEAVERLEMDCAVDENGRPVNQQALDYIITVDIFNEGVDIPQINQVIMLRPTQSAIIFVQQLGRGLRKAEGKEFVVVLDFIGNYSNNFLIPIALSGDRTYNKDTVRKYVREGARVIPGSSTIHFDEITKKRIFESIDKMTTTKKMLADKYYQVKYKLGRIPTILDFYKLGEVDPMLFIQYAKTYHHFLRMVDKEYTTRFSAKEEQVLTFVSALIVDGKRPHELLMLRMIASEMVVDEVAFARELKKMGDTYRQEDFASARRMLSMDFIAGSDAKKYAAIELISAKEANQDMLVRSFSFFDQLKHMEFRQELNRLIDYGMLRYQDLYANHDENNMVLYEKYSRKDVCRLMNWDKDESSTMYGYRIKHNTCPIFVTYEKKEDISGSTKYEDAFVNNQTFSWMTRNGVSLDSRESMDIINYQQSGLKICLFVKKSDGEGTDFYYMGEVEPTQWRQTTIQNDKGKALPIVNFVFRLKHRVREDIYEYLTE